MGFNLSKTISRFSEVREFPSQWAKEEGDDLGQEDFLSYREEIEAEIDMLEDELVTLRRWLIDCSSLITSHD